LEREWLELQSAADTRGLKLQQAVAQLDFNRFVLECSTWCDNLASTLATGDLGRDVASVRTLVKRHDLSLAEFAQQKAQLVRVQVQCRSLVDSGHFRAPEIQRTTKEIGQRYDELAAALELRGHALDDAETFYEYRVDAQFELVLLEEKLTQALSTDFGQDTTSALSLQKMHQVLRSDCQARFDKVEELVVRQDGLPEEYKPLSQEVIDNLVEVQDLLQGTLVDRAEQLKEAVALQQFADECESFRALAEDKHELALWDDYGRDISTTRAYMQQHQSLASEVEVLAVTSKELNQRGLALLTAGHPSSSQIRQQLDQMIIQMENLQSSVDHRTQALSDLHAYFESNVLAEDAEAWLEKQLVLAQSQDIGEDHGRCVELQESNDAFAHGIKTTKSEIVDPYLVSSSNLLDNGHPRSAEVLSRQQEIEARWTLVSEAVAKRSALLEDALSIHHFNREAEELLTRLQEKSKVMKIDTSGKDLTALQAVQRKHLAAQGDVSALEQQVAAVETLALEVTALDGQQTERTKERLAEVHQAWNELDGIMVDTSTALERNLAIQRSQHQIRELEAWCAETKQQLQVIPKPNTVEAAQAAIDELSGHRASIRAEGPRIASIQGHATDLIVEHGAGAEVLTTALARFNSSLSALDEYEALRRVEFAQTALLLEYERGTNALGNAQLVLSNSIKSLTTPLSPAEANRSLAKWQELNARCELQHGKVTTIQSEVESFRSSGHFALENIEGLAQDLDNQQAYNEAALVSKKQLLEEVLKFELLKRDLADIQQWIGSNMRYTQDDSHRDLANLTHKLQQHRTFEQNVMARSDQIEVIQDRCDELIDATNFGSETISTEATRLLESWQSLLEAVDGKTADIKQASKVHGLLSQMDDVKSDLSARTKVVENIPPGNSYDEAKRSKHRLEDIKTALPADQARVETIAESVRTTTDEAPRYAGDIRARHRELVSGWNGLQSAMAKRASELNAATEVQAYFEELEEAKAWMAEKRQTVELEDLGKDVPSVESLQRKHDAAVRDFGAVDEKLSFLGKEARRLQRVHRNAAEQIRTKQSEADESWAQCHALAQQRQVALSDALDLFKFLSQARDLKSWNLDTTATISRAEDPSDVQTAEIVNKAHKECKAEIDARESNYASLQQQGRRLTNRKHYASDRIDAQVAEVLGLKAELATAWSERKRHLDECSDLQLFLRDADQVERGVAQLQSSVDDATIGATLQEVEEQLKVHSEFEKAVLTQDEKCHALESFGFRLSSEHHFDHERVTDRAEEIVGLQKALENASNTRKNMLSDAHLLQQFLRDCLELQEWISQREAIAADQSYLDSTGLTRKIQKQQAFVAELQANEGRVGSIEATTERMKDDRHFALAQFQGRARDIRTQWENLEAASADKSKKLRQAEEALEFHNRAHDILHWCEEATTSLRSDDLGKDLSSVQRLQKSQEQLLAEMLSNDDRVLALRELADQGISSGSFKARELQDEFQQVAEASRLLPDFAEERMLALASAEDYYLWLRDVSSELVWLKSRNHVASSEDFGSDLPSVQSMLKKLVALKTEVNGREPTYKALATRGKEMVSRRHYATSHIHEKQTELRAAWDALANSLVVRQQGLDDSRVAQQFFSRVDEAKAWLNEKEPQVLSVDYGDDEDSTQTFIQQHEQVASDLTSYTAIIDELQLEADAIRAANNSLSADVQQQCHEAGQLFIELRSQASHRLTKLAETLLSHQYERMHATVDVAFQKAAAIANVRDPGMDKPSCDALLAKHERSLEEVRKLEKHLDKLDAFVDDFKSIKHPDAGTINAQVDDQHAAWDRIEAALEEQSVFLRDALERHSLDHEVADVVQWMAEKEGSVRPLPADLTLSVIERLQRLHNVFLRDVDALDARKCTLLEAGSKTASRQPSYQPSIQESLTRMNEPWERLQRTAQDRQKRLTELQRLHSWLQHAQDLDDWIRLTKDTMQSEEVGPDLASVEIQLSRQKDRDATIEANRIDLANVSENGRELVAGGHPDSDAIAARIVQLTERFVELEQTAAKTYCRFEEAVDGYQFLKEVGNAQAWINMREANLDSEIDFDNVDDIDGWIKKHEDFERSLAAQDARFAELNGLTLVRPTRSSRV
jgi:hypothetical protein